MGIDKKIIEEIKRYKSINNYILEQDASLAPPAPEGAVPPPPGDAPVPGDVPPPAPEGAVPPPPAAPETDTPQPVDVSQDPDVEEVGKDEEDKEELEITDLVDAQKNIEQKQEDYFNQLFGQLENLESKLGEMDKLMDAVNSLEQRFEKFRPKTPEEKLELRSLDSGPFNQKLSQYFEDKEDQFEKQGREEYILTTDEVEDFSPKQIKTTFDTYDDEDMMP
jgi:hypothetical protein